MKDIKPYLAKVATGQTLSRQEASEAFEIIMSGDATPSQIGAFLMALRVRGEDVDEIAGAVATMRSHMLKVDAPEDAIDIVGTGGDASGTYNVSTCAAFIIAGAGVTVAKHGNKALSSNSGAGDVLSALGINVDLDPEEISACISEAGLGFMFAPRHHSAMRHVGPTRVEMGTRTIFNLLGPLCNPAGVQRYMLGVFAAEWVEPLAKVLGDLGATRAWVVHGSFDEAGGLDEISTTGPTKVAMLKDGDISLSELTPEDFGVPLAAPEALKGGDATVNAAALRAVLAGEENAYRDIALVNAAAGLIVAGQTDDIAEAMSLARSSIASGKAAEVAAKVAKVSNR